MFGGPKGPHDVAMATYDEAAKAWFEAARSTRSRGASDAAMVVAAPRFEIGISNVF